MEVHNAESMRHDRTSVQEPHSENISFTAKPAQLTTDQSNTLQAIHDGEGHHEDFNDQDESTSVRSRDATISIDSNEHDDDSAVGDLSLPRSTVSVRSSLYDYVEEHGRTYHRYKEGSYALPNDDREQERLDMQHHLCKMTFDNKLFLAPISDNPQHVLDIGTGTGIWAIDFAIQHPSAQVIGTDLSPIQPEMVPQNCVFEVEDVEDDWTYSQKFDFIHWRFMISCFKDPRRVIEQAFDSLAPGGYAEFHDVDFPFRAVDSSLEGTALKEWNLHIMAAGAKAGRPWTNVSKYKQWMIDIGFLDVEEQVFQWPLNTWPKDPQLKKLAMWVQHDLLEGLDSTKALFLRSLGWTPEELELFLVDVRKDIKNKKVHAFASTIVVYGRKPPLCKTDIEVVEIEVHSPGV